MSRREKRLQDLALRRGQEQISYRDFRAATLALLPSEAEWEYLRTKLGYQPGWTDYCLTETEIYRQRLIEKCQNAGSCVLEEPPFPARPDWLKMLAKKARTPLYIVQMIEGELDYAAARSQAKRRIECDREMVDFFLSGLRQRRESALMTAPAAAPEAQARAGDPAPAVDSANDQVGDNALDAFSTAPEKDKLMKSRYAGKRADRHIRERIQKRKHFYSSSRSR